MNKRQMCKHRCSKAEIRCGSLSDETRAAVSLLGKARGGGGGIRHVGVSVSTVSASKLLETGSHSC